MWQGPARLTSVPAVQDNVSQLLSLANWMADAALQASSADGSQAPYRAGAASPRSKNRPCRAVLWLAACVALPPTGQLQGHVATPAPDTGRHRAAAQQLLRVCAAVPSEQKAEAVPATILVLVRVLQPLFACMLGADMAEMPTEQAASQVAHQPDEALRWRFLLGNTLPRMLEELQLPEDRIVRWWRAAAGLSQVPAAGSRSSAGVMPDQEAARAACELAYMILSTLCMGHAPHAAVAMLQCWRRGSEGGPRQSMADLEALHARAVSAVL